MTKLGVFHQQKMGPYGTQWSLLQRNVIAVCGVLHVRHVYICTCSCMDSTLHATVCKHVHIIKMTSSSTSVKKCSPATSHPNDKLKYFTNLLSDKVQATKLETQRQKLLTKINEISVLVNECESTDALKMSSSHLNSTIVALKAARDTPVTLTRKRKVPPNKNAEKQHRFFSTKKRQRTSSSTLNKPSHTEAQEIKSSLLEVKTTSCGICLEEEDSTKSDLIDWLQCCSCHMWVHKTCVDEPTDNAHDYTCQFCVSK